MKAFQDLKVLSLVDGAHGIGHIDLTHLESVGPDLFTRNCYNYVDALSFTCHAETNIWYAPQCPHRKIFKQPPEKISMVFRA